MSAFLIAALRDSRYLGTAKSSRKNFLSQNYLLVASKPCCYRRRRVFPAAVTFFFFPVLAVTIRCTPPQRSSTLTMRPSTAMPRYPSHRMSSSPRQSCGTLLRSVGVRTCRNTPQNPLYFDKFAQNLVYSTTKAQPRVGQRSWQVTRRHGSGCRRVAIGVCIGCNRAAVGFRIRDYRSRLPAGCAGLRLHQSRPADKGAGRGYLRPPVHTAGGHHGRAEEPVRGRSSC